MRKHKPAIKASQLRFFDLIFEKPKQEGETPLLNDEMFSETKSKKDAENDKKLQKNSSDE